VKRRTYLRFYPPPRFDFKGRRSRSLVDRGPHFVMRLSSAYNETEDGEDRGA